MKREKLMTLCAKVADEVEKAVNSYGGRFSKFMEFVMNEYNSFCIFIEDTGKEEDNVVFNETLYASKEFLWREMTPENLLKMKEEAIRAMRDYTP